MRMLTQILLVLSFAIVSVAVALMAPEYADIEEASGYLLGGGIFAVALTIFLLVQQGLVREDVENRFAIVRHDLVEISETLNRMFSDMDDMTLRLETGGGKNKELVAEIKVLQTLLSQVATKGARPSGKVSGRPLSKADGDEIATYDAPSQPNITGVSPEPSEIYDIMRNALQDNRVDLYLQPVVSLPSRRTVHYECYSRVRDETGRIIFPTDYLPVAMESGLTGTLDNLLLFRCIQVVRRLGPRRPGVRFFCNISSSSLHDSEFFPQFIEYMLSNPALSERMIFEFSQTDIRSMGERVERRLMRLGENGFRFSVDHVTDLSLDIPGLAQRYFSFVKVDTDVLLSKRGNILSEDLKAAMERFDIGLIAAKIEEEKSVVDVLDHNIDFGQGFLFGEPKPTRAGPQVT